MQLHYRKQGSGKPIIILHGLFGSSDNWMSIGRELAESHEVWLVDQRNHGASPHTDAFNYQLLAADLKGFIEEHQIENPIILGHSMGGKTAMFFAVENPQLFDRLIVADIAPKAYRVHHDSILEGLCSLDLKQIASRQEADEQLAKYVDEAGVRAFLLKNLARDKDNGFVWKINLPVLNDKIEEIVRGLEANAVSDKPTLFIRGANSNYIKDSDHIAIMNFFPNAEIKTIAGAGHWLHAEKPEEFLQIVKDFIPN
jgi:esterase